MVWTSMGQDGSREGVYRQFVHENGSPVGGEFLVNTTTVSQQMRAGRGLGWRETSFWPSGPATPASPYNFDLFAQRYLNVAALLLPMDAPFVYAPFTLSNGVYQPQLQVSWPPLLGIAVSNLKSYVDGAGIADRRDDPAIHGR